MLAYRFFLIDPRAPRKNRPSLRNAVPTLGMRGDRAGECVLGNRLFQQTWPTPCSHPVPAWIPQACRKSRAGSPLSPRLPAHAPHPATMSFWMRIRAVIRRKRFRVACAPSTLSLCIPYSNRVGAKPIRDAHRMQLSHGSLHCSTTAHLAKSVEHFGIGSQGDIMEVRVNPCMTAQGDNRWLWK